jgi:tripartite-type tricarboxylate transporter receptor subunit TctC
LFSRRSFIASSAAVIALPSQSFAQTNQITLIVPFAAGGPTDVIARIAAEGMSRKLGQRVVVENVAGAGGATGVLRAARSNPDGRTIVLGNLGTHGAAPSATPNLPYDPRADFEPIGMIAATPILLVVRDGLPATNMQEFVALMRSKPDGFTYGHAGQGVTSHTAALLLSDIAGIKQVGVTYRGTAPALNDMLVGVLDYICDQSVIMVEQVKSGKIRALVVASSKRLASLPDVPTAAEAGFPDFSITAWNALFAPKGTDKGLVETYAKALSDALDEPDLQQRLMSFDAEVPAVGEARSSASLGRHVVAEVERWGQLAR